MQSKKLSPVVKYGLMFLCAFFILGFLLHIKENGISEIMSEFSLGAVIFLPTLFVLLAIVLLGNKSKNNVGVTTTEDKKRVYKRQTIVTLVLSIWATYLFINWFKQPNSNEAVWIYGLFLLIPVILLWTICLSYFNKYKKEKKLD